MGVCKTTKELVFLQVSGVRWLAKKKYQAHLMPF